MISSAATADTTKPGRVVVVVVEGCGIDDVRAAHTLARHTTAALVVVANGSERPDVNPRLADLTSSILDALGHLGVRRARRRFEGNLQRAVPFLAVSDATDLVVCDADTLGVLGLEQLLILTQTCGQLLWLLLDDPLTRPSQDLLAGWLDQAWTPTRFSQHWGQLLGLPSGTLTTHHPGLLRQRRDPQHRRAARYAFAPAS